MVFEGPFENLVISNPTLFMFFVGIVFVCVYIYNKIFITPKFKRLKKRVGDTEEILEYKTNKLQTDVKKVLEKVTMILMILTKNGMYDPLKEPH